MKQMNLEFMEIKIVQLPISEDEYKHLLTTNVACSTCNSILSKDEILSHSSIGIIKKEDMQCQSCWLEQYEQY